MIGHYYTKQGPSAGLRNLDCTPPEKWVSDAKFKVCVHCDTVFFKNPNCTDKQWNMVEQCRACRDTRSLRNKKKSDG